MKRSERPTRAAIDAPNGQGSLAHQGQRPTWAAINAPNGQGSLAHQGERPTWAAINAPNGQGNLAHQGQRPTCAAIYAPKAQGILAQGLPWVPYIIGLRPVGALECRNAKTAFLAPTQSNSGASNRPPTGNPTLLPRNV
jgi:hypothetical protein